MPEGALTAAGPSTPPLVGRHTEFAALHDRLRELTRGRGDVALVIGEAGAGKSSLLRSVAGSTRDKNIRLIWAVGDELSQAFPLLPLVEAVGGTRQAMIAGLLRGRDTDGTVVTDPVLAASEQLVAWIDDLCNTTPVLLVLDDLHWADPASVRLWHRFTRMAEQLPLLVIGAMRPGHDRDDLTVVRRRVIDLRAIGRAALLELEPLGSDAVTELVAALVGGTPGRRLSELAATAGGNPLYLTELMGALARDGALSTNAEGHVDATSGQAPASLSAAITDRLNQVPQQVQDVLRAAALLGVEFSVANLATASGRSVAELAGMLGRAQNAGVLETVHSGMAFRHPLIRDVLCEQIPAGVRAAWHQEMGRMLARAGQSSAVVARQLVAAIEVGGELPATDWLTDWLIVEGPVLANQSVQVAKTLLTEALGRIPLTDPRRIAVATPLASALHRAGEYDACERIGTQALSHVDTRRIDDEQLLDIYSTMVESQLSQSRFKNMLAMANELGSMRDWSPRHLVRIDIMRARAMNVLQRDEKAEALAAECLARAQEVGDPAAIGWACNLLGVINIVRNNEPEGLEFLERGITAVEGDPTQLDVYLCLLANRTWGQYQLLDFDDPTGSVARTRQLAERVGNRRRLLQAELFQAYRLYQLGEWHDLFAHLDTVELQDFGESHPFTEAAIAALHCDDLETAQRFTEIAEALDARRPEIQDAGNMAVLRGAWLEHQGKPNEALDEMMPGVRGEWQRAFWPTADVVRLAVACGRRADAETAAAFAQTSPYKHVRQGLVPLCRGLLDRDPTALEETVRFCRAKKLRPQLAKALEALGLVWAERGDNTQARPAMIEALDLYEKIGATWDVNRMRATFREHGMRTGSHATRKRPTTGWESLTETETTVAHLVAQGHSNPHIAEQLFLSRRTVETHVSHILAKLGLRSRVDIARTAPAKH